MLYKLTIMADKALCCKRVDINGSHVLNFSRARAKSAACLFDGAQLLGICIVLSREICISDAFQVRDIINCRNVFGKWIGLVCGNKI